MKDKVDCPYCDITFMEIEYLSYHLNNECAGYRHVHHYAWRPLRDYSKTPDFHGHYIGKIGLTFICVGDIITSRTGCDDEGGFDEQYTIIYDTKQFKFVAKYDENVSIDIDELDWNIKIIKHG